MTMEYGTITGRLVAAVADTTDDPDVNPDIVPISGTVTFTPSVKAILVVSEDITVVPAPIVAALDANGYVSLNGVQGVTVLATNSTYYNPTGWTYRVSFDNLSANGRRVTFDPYNIEVPVGANVDLSFVTPITGSTGTAIVRGPKGDKGDTGATGPQGIPGNNVPTDTAVAGFINQAGSQTRVAADGRYSVETVGTPNRSAVGSIVSTGGAIIDGLGTADDGTVINTAMNSSALVQTWSLPPNVSLNIVTGVNVPAGKTLRGHVSTVLKKSSGAGQVLFLNAGSAVEGLTIDGNGLVQYCSSANAADATYRGVTFRGSLNYGMNCASDRLVVDRCQFIGLPSYAVLTSGGANHRYTDNYVTGGRGIQLGGTTSDSVVSGNTLNLTAGVGIEPFGASVKRISIVNNTIVGTFVIGISMASAFGCSVSGNVVSGASQIGIENAEGASHNTITGNAVSSGAGSGISVTTSNDATKPLRNVVVSSNSIWSVGAEGIGVVSGRGLKIVNNVIRNATGSGIILRTNPVNCTIEDNEITTTDAVSVAPAGISVTGTGHKIVNNRVDQGERSAVAQGSGILCIGGSDHTIFGNRIENTRFGIELNSTGTTVLADNRTIGTGTNSLAIYGSASTTTIVYRHFARFTTGTMTNSDINATVTGPLVTI